MCVINVCGITVLMHCSVSCVLTDFSLLIMKTGAVDIFGSISKRLFLFPVVPSWVFSLVIGEHTSEMAYLHSKLKPLSLLLALPLCLWEYCVFKIYSRPSERAQWVMVLATKPDNLPS